MPQFLIRKQDVSGGRAFLTGEEARHARNAMRLRAGDPIRLFDGEGTGYRGTVKAVSNRGVEVEVGPAFTERSEFSAELVLAQAVLPPDAMSEVVVRATEIGASRIVPFLAERSQARFYAARWKEKGERLKKLALAACKQCERLSVPGIEPPASFDRLLEEFPRYSAVFFADRGPTARILKTCLPPPSEVLPGAVLIVIGPEGGFSEEEREKVIGAGGTAVTFGSAILRSQTAAVYLLSVLACHLHVSDTR